MNAIASCRLGRVLLHALCLLPTRRTRAGTGAGLCASSTREGEAPPNPDQLEIIGRAPRQPSDL